MENKDKINFDLDFLDKNTKEKPKKENSSSKDPNWVFYKGKAGQPQNPPEVKSSSKGWLWILGIVGVIALAGIFSDSSTNSSTSTTGTSPNSDLVKTGNYMCQSYDSSQADKLAPSLTVKSYLNSQSQTLDSKADSLSAEKDEIDSEYVDENDQYSIDQHNARVDDYNNRLQIYRNEVSAYKSSMEDYNTRVDTYNNYLRAHCRPN